MSAETYQIGKLLLNAGTQEVTRDGEPVPLPPLSFSLLLTLARHAPNVVTTAQLEEEVWSGLVIDRGTINKRVVLVRNALRKAGCDKDYIAVVRGTGYRLNVPVTRLDEQPEAGSTDAPVVAPPPAPVEPAPAGSNLRWLVIALVLVVLVAVVLSERRFSDAPGASATGSLESRDRPEGFTGADSVAVLPFLQAGDGEEAAFFAEGVAREILHLLDHYPELSVASSASSFALRDSELSPTEIGERLGVETLLTGSVHREEGRIIVMPSLVHAASGRTLWADSFDQPENAIFDVQGEIADRVAALLGVSRAALGAGDDRAANTGSIEAYTLYLQGRSLLDERIHRGAEPVVEALDAFRSAAQLDPNFLRAHVGTATASFLMSSYGDPADRDDWLMRAEASARYALDLDPSAPEALGVLAAIVSWQGDPLRAAGLFDRALQLGSRDPDILHWHAMLSTSMGYFEPLLPTLEDAYRLDPLNQLLGCSLAGSLNFSGRPDEALLVLDGMERFSRRDLSTAVASLYLRDWETARAMLRGIRLREGPLPDAYADLLVEAFENPPRRAFVEQAFVSGAAEQALPPLVAFEALLILGSPRAFDLEATLEGTWFEHRLPEAVWHNWGVDLRRDARFKGWVRALGYDQHWRKYGWPDRCRPTGLNDFECV